MQLDQRTIKGLWLGPTKTSHGTLPPRFEDQAQGAWRVQVADQFTAFVEAKMQGMHASIFPPAQNRFTPLPPVYWVMPESRKQAEHSLEALLDGVRSFLKTMPEAYRVGEIALTIVAKELRTGTLNEVVFRGSVGQLSAIRVKHFWPRIPTLLSAANIFAAFLIPLLVAALLILGFRRDTGLIFDFAAYTLPIIAACVSGASLYFERLQRPCFWASAIILTVGACFYLIAKQADMRLPVAFTLLLICSLLSLVLAEEIVFGWRNHRRFSIFRTALWFVTLLAIPSALLLYAKIRPDTIPDCQFKSMAPVTMTVIATNGAGKGDEATKPMRLLSLKEGTLMTVTACSQEPIPTP